MDPVKTSLWGAIIMLALSVGLIGIGISATFRSAGLVLVMGCIGGVCAVILMLSVTLKNRGR